MAAAAASRFSRPQVGLGEAGEVEGRLDFGFQEMRERQKVGVTPPFSRVPAFVVET
jgi:hypothetical protein